MPDKCLEQNNQQNCILFNLCLTCMVNTNFSISCIYFVIYLEGTSDHHNKQIKKKKKSSSLPKISQNV